MKSRGFVATIGLSLFVGATLRADLKWDQTTIEVRTGPNDQVAVAHFKYQNVGKKPVRFTQVKPACGCTTVQTQQDEVPPGEKGEITARLNIGDRTGISEKTITVSTEDPVPATTVLTIRAVIPVPLEIEPNFLFWQYQEDTKPKTIIVKTTKEWKFPIRALKVSSSSWDFKSDVEKTGEGQFKVKVQPLSTNKGATAMLTIQPEDSTRKFEATLRVIAPMDPSQGVPASAQSQELLKNPFDGPDLPTPPSP
jgi:hypothetical protein